MAVLITGGLLFLFKWIAGIAPPLNPKGQTGDGFTQQNNHLVRAFQAIVFIPATLIAGVHLYGISSFLIGQSYLVDFAKPAIVIIGMLAAGFVFGALFGLPKRLRGASSDRDDAGADTSEAKGRAKAPLYAEFGDRLEPVADWLTKLLLGAGLTQLHWVWQNGPTINDFFASATGMKFDKPLGTVFAMGGLSAGFLLGYIASLLFLPVALQAGVKVLEDIFHGRAGDIETAKVEAAKVEAAKVEAANVEAAKVEAAKVEAAKVEAAKVEVAKVEAAKVETAKVEAAKVEAAKVDGSA